MDGAILALVAPLLMKEFAIDLSTYRSGVQIALFVSIIGLYLWPWLADKFGRRNILALNIAIFSLAMPLVALSPGWGSFVAIYSVVRFALNGEWAVGSMLVAETWPARLRGLVLSVDRSAWGIGAALAGVLVTFIVTGWGWRAAYVLPVLVALRAVYVRLLCRNHPIGYVRKTASSASASARAPVSLSMTGIASGSQKPSSLVGGNYSCPSCAATR
jgi:MFS family permease